MPIMLNWYSLSPGHGLPFCARASPATRPKTNPRIRSLCIFLLSSFAEFLPVHLLEASPTGSSAPVDPSSRARDSGTPNHVRINSKAKGGEDQEGFTPKSTSFSFFLNSLL